MKDLIVKINLAEKILYFNDGLLKLNKGSFESVVEQKPEEAIKGGCKPGERCIQLIYKNNKDIYEDVGEVTSLMKKEGLGKQLRISAYEHGEDVIQIIGKYKLELTETSYQLPTSIFSLP